MAGRRVVIVGGGASGGLLVAQLLRRGAAGLEIQVLEPRPEPGLGAAFSTRDPWHRLNVAAITMSALPDDPDHFRRWAGAAPEAFLPRMTWGRYLREILVESEAGSAARLVHRRERATGLAVDAASPAVTTAAGEVIVADAVVIATGNDLPAVPSFLEAFRVDPRFVADPWAPASLDPVADGETVAIIGTGLTAVDLAATLVRSRPACHVVMLSRRGDLPRAHEDPWRPRPPEPAFTVDELRAAADPFAFARERITGHPGGWRQGLDSLRPIHVPIWLAMDDGQRRSFVDEWRHTWEIHRSRVAAEVLRDVEGWIAGGRLVVRAAPVGSVVADGARLRVEAVAGESAAGESAAGKSAAGGAVLADHVLLATGPDERPAANPFLAAAIAAGVLREGPVGLGIDVDPGTLRVRDAHGATDRPIWALGPVLKGALWETTAIPEIRAQAAQVAAAVLEGLGAA